jgi:hypothetical protein
VSVLSDRGVGRIFGGARGSLVNSTAYAFDPSHYRTLATLNVPGPFGTVDTLAPLLRWGRDGIAFQSAPGFFGQPRLYSIESASFVLPRSSSNELPPAVDSLAPANVSAGSPNLRLIINGSNFVPGAVAELDQSKRETVFVSEDKLLVYVPASDLAKAGKRSITVSNPNHPGDSNVVKLTVH